MTDERDERLFERAAASLRQAGNRDDDALADLLAALRHKATDDADSADDLDLLPRVEPSRPRRRPIVTRGAVRFIAGLAAGIAFAAGLGIGLLTGWRMRGESYRLAAEEITLRALPAARAVTGALMPALRPVQFMLVAPSATRVALVGEFNDWDPVATPMSRAPGGAWHVALPLARGRHVYAFVVDGSSWVADPQAPLAPERWFGVRNSVLLVDGEQRP
jgi:hypothetical protein